MRRLAYAYCLLFVAVLGISGCPGTGFGPFPNNVLDPSRPPGVAYFVPGTVPGENQFQILVVNTDTEVAHFFYITSDASETIYGRWVPGCSVGRFVGDCEATAILIEAYVFIEDDSLPLGGHYIIVTLTITPNEDCSQRVIFLAAYEETIFTEGEDGSFETETVQTYRLTESVPYAIYNCNGLSG